MLYIISINCKIIFLLNCSKVLALFGSKNISVGVVLLLQQVVLARPQRAVPVVVGLHAPFQLL